MREVHDTVKGCQAGNAAICYQLISQNAEKIVAFNRANQPRAYDYDDPKGTNQGGVGPGVQVRPLYSGSCCPCPRGEEASILLLPEEYWFT